MRYAINQLRNYITRRYAKDFLPKRSLISTAVRPESAIKDAKSMCESMSANGTEHGAVNEVKKKNSKMINKKPTGDTAKNTSHAKVQNACYRCSTVKHKANLKSCPRTNMSQMR